MKIPIHVSLSQQLLADLDRWRGKEPRSSVITKGIKRMMEEQEGVIIEEITTPVMGNMFHARICGCWNTANCPSFKLIQMLIKDTES